MGNLSFRATICISIIGPDHPEMLMAARNAEHPEYDSLAIIEKAADRIAASTTQFMNINMSSNDRGEKE